MVPFRTPIAATDFPVNSYPEMHVFFLRGYQINESICKADGWSQPAQICHDSVAHAGKLAACSFARDAGGIDVRVYYTGDLNAVN